MNSENTNDVIKYIKNNPYCKAEDIVEDLNHKMSRATIFKILENLKKREIIQNVSDNRRQNKFIIVENNEFNIIQKELIDFKSKFYSLLEKSLNHPAIMYVLSKIRSNRYENENSKIILTAYVNAMEEYKKSIEILVERNSIIRKLNNPFFGDKVKKESQFSNHEGEFVVYRIPKSNIYKINKFAKRNLDLIEKINLLFEKYVIHIKSSGYTALTLLPIYLFILLVQFLILKSTSIWPGSINDKDALIKLNGYVYEEIVEINLELAKYLSKSNRNLQISKIVELNDYRITRDPDDVVREIYCVYSILGMELEIRNVLESFNIIRKKSVDYNIEEKVMDSVKENSKLALELKDEIRKSA